MPVSDVERALRLLMNENKQLRHENKLLRAQVNYWEAKLLKDTLPPLSANPEHLTPALLRRQAE